MKLPYYLKMVVHSFLRVTEIYYWDKNLKPGNRQPWMEELINPETRKKFFPEQLSPYIQEIRARKAQVNILEVGSGPISILASQAQEGLFNLTAIDPLAEEYLGMLRKYKIVNSVKPIKGLCENLLEIFPKESFDIVFSQNALDHAIDVARCIENIHGVLSKDGILFLQGFVREGSHKKWMGLHQHDLAPLNGELIHYDKKAHPTTLTSKFRCISQEQSGVKPGDGYRIIFRKR